MSWVGARVAGRTTSASRRRHRRAPPSRPRSPSPRAYTASRVDPDELGGVGVLGRRSQLAPELREAENELQAAEHDDRDAERQHVEPRDRQAARHLPARRPDAALVERVHVRREEVLQQVRDHDEQPERRQQRHELSRAEAALEHRPLEDVADDERAGEHRREREIRRDVHVLGEEKRHVRADERERSVREVDDPHHPEHQREAGREQRVEPAEQDPVDDGVDPGHAVAPRRSPKYASVTCSRVSSPRGPSSTIRPSSMQTTRSATPMRAREVLLDEHDRRAALDQRAERAVDALDDDRREAERDLVEQQQPRVRHERATDRRRLLLAAGEARRALVPQRLQHRERLEHRVDRPRPAPPRRRSTTRRFSSTVSSGRAGGPRGRARSRSCTRRCAGRRVMSLAVEARSAAGGAVRAGDRAQQRRLPRAVGADQRERLALVDLERHLPHGLEQPVADVEPLDLEQAHRAPSRGRRR